MLTPEETAAMNHVVPSIIDSLKIKMGLDPTLPLQDPHRNPTRKKYDQKKETGRPSVIGEMPTVPKLCQKEVSLQIKYPPQTSDFESLLPPEVIPENLRKLNSMQREFIITQEVTKVVTGNTSNKIALAGKGVTTLSQPIVSPRGNSGDKTSALRKLLRRKSQTKSKSPSMKDGIDNDLDEETKAYLDADLDDPYEEYLKQQMNQ